MAAEIRGRLIVQMSEEEIIALHDSLAENILELIARLAKQHDVDEVVVKSALRMSGHLWA